MLLVMLLSVGCDDVFGAHVIEVDAGAPYDRCAPGGYDDPLRYAELDNPLPISATGIPSPWSWSTARTACLARGMDLAVISDVHEMGIADIEFRPYWVGSTFDGSAWSSVDDCPSLATASASGMACGTVDGTLAIDGNACGGVLPGPDAAVVEAALCETPRPAMDSCLGAESPGGPALEAYTISPDAMTFADARAFCAGLGGHVAVIDSFIEWKLIVKLARDQQLPSFWLGSTFDGQTWQTETGCPAVYSWTTNTPVFGDATTCAAATMVPDADPDNPALTGTRLDGVTPSSCTTASLHALCEVEQP